ncbi:MAG: hypothetical protein M3220_02865 [Chloroflexota bacterium]|nr:hypothetical protein [Chloroflexota bacterium]
MKLSQGIDLTERDILHLLSTTQTTLVAVRAVRRKRFWFVIALGLLLIASTLGRTASPAAAADPVDDGYRGFQFPHGAGGDSAPTGEKPESKVWWHDGVWWGSLYREGDDAYYIYKLDLTTQEWLKTDTQLDDRLATKADTLWDGEHLYVLSHLYPGREAVPPSSDPDEWGRLYRYSYHAGSQSYGLDPGFPATVTRGPSETLVLAKDSTGTLWVTYVQKEGDSYQVMINHSGNSDSDWEAPYPLPVGTDGIVSRDDTASIIAYKDHIGVMWSSQRSGNKMYFAVHQDGDPTTTWQSILAYDTSGDDHINLKSLESDGSGKVFAVIKTSRSAALIVLLSCTNGECGSATNWRADIVSDSTHSPTRPILLLDTSNDDLYVFLRNKDDKRHGGIYYKRTAMNSIQFDKSDIGVPFIRSQTATDINNPTSTKQNLNANMGLVVLASDEEERYYFHNYLPLGSTPPTSTATPTATQTPTHTMTPTATTTATHTATATNTPTLAGTATTAPSSTPTLTATQTPPTTTPTVASTATRATTATVSLSSTPSPTVTTSPTITPTTDAGSNTKSRYFLPIVLE